jgi:hypothetical protein
LLRGAVLEKCVAACCLFVQSDVQPVWKPAAPPAPAAGGRRLHGPVPTNKAQIKRIEELLKVRAALVRYNTISAALQAASEILGDSARLGAWHQEWMINHKHLAVPH